MNITERTAHLNNDRLVVLHFPYDIALVGKLKIEVPERKWNKNEKIWTAPISVSLIRFLRNNNFQIGEGIVIKKKIILPKGLWKFQRIGIKRTVRFGNRALIADAPGLGKTIQGLGWLYAQPELYPALIIGPAVAKPNWARETKKWLKIKPLVLSGHKAYKRLQKCKKSKVVIVNYEILRNYGHKAIRRKADEEAKGYNNRRKIEFVKNHLLLKELKETNFKSVIIDECHYLNNAKTLQTTVCLSLLKPIENILALSGTPITSKPSQFFLTLNLLRRDLFPSFWSYAKRYCGATFNGFGWDFSGASNIPELHKLLTDNLMIRRTKADVYKHLPKKIRSLVPLEITNRKEYTLAENDFIAWLKSKNKDTEKEAIQLTKIEMLKQICIKGKIKAVIEWIKAFIQNEKKIVIFTHHINIRKRLLEEFKDISIEAKGGAKNQEAADIFQTDPKILLFIGGNKSANISLTLTAASYMAIIELPDNPGDLQQMEDRIYARINDMHGCNIYLLLAKDTIEQDLAKMLDKKLKILTAVLDGKEVKKVDLITPLLKKYKKRGENK